MTGNSCEDPADSIVTATALTLPAPVITKDEKLLDYPYIETIW